MKKAFEISTSFPVKPHVIFDAWLDSKTHSEMTGGEAICNNQLLGEFSAWDGYITGSNIELKSPNWIKQHWRTTEFDEKEGDSLVLIKIEAHKGGCKVILRHSNIPEGNADYQQGWVDFYFTPMKAYFSR